MDSRIKLKEMENVKLKEYCKKLANRLTEKKADDQASPSIQKVC